MLEKIVDLALDERNILFIAPNYMKKRQINKKLDELDPLFGTEIDLALTFDVEYDFGSSGRKKIEFVKNFLENMTILLKKHNITATFFVQGNLVEENSKELKKLEAMGNEIALHGWGHEPWGNAWFIKEKIPTLKERKEAIEKSLSAFKKAGLKRPISFRAPNMVIDQQSMNLLEQNGFKCDSSWSSYRSPSNTKWKINSILEVPVSANPKPELNLPKGIKYEVLNFSNLYGKGAEKLEKTCENIIKIQGLEKQRSFLVFLAHSWEFFSPDEVTIGDFDSNFQTLTDFIKLLGSKYDIKLVNMMELLV